MEMLANRHKLVKVMELCSCELSNYLLLIFNSHRCELTGNLVGTIIISVAFSNKLSIGVDNSLVWFDDKDVV